MTTLREAQRLAEWGFRVLPSTARAKTPAMWLVGEDPKWRRWRDEDTAPHLERWFSGRECDLVVVTGLASGRIVLDIDTVDARDLWVGILGEEVLRSVPHAASPRASELGDLIGHFYFPVDRPVRNRSGDGYDIKGDGGVVKAPPSAGYRWVLAPWDCPDPPKAPEELIGGEYTTGGPEGSRKAKKAGPEGNVRSMLSDVVANLGGSGRNNDVTRLAGHLAKHHRIRDQYDAMMELVWDRVHRDDLDGTYTRAEFEKTRESIWESEVSKPNYLLGEHNGYLVGTGDELRVQTRVEGETGLDHWGDFDMEAVGVVDDGDQERLYHVLLHRRGRDDVRDLLLPSSTLADSRSLSTWLAQQGCGFAPPDAMWPKSGSAGERLRRYLDAQEPPTFQTVRHLGWQEPDGFICHEGRITAEDGLLPHATYRPHPRLAASRAAPYRYGFDDGWREVLREVLTFHDPEVCSVFGAWVMALLLRPQIRRHTSQFPFMAIQATSGSGKSTGFFSLMVQLTGNYSGHIVPTAAALRDYIGAHRNGVVWVDDLDDIGHLTELLRSSTVEGAAVKKGEDNTGQTGAQLVSGVVVSGEHLGLSHQKALADRAVLINAPDPKSRMSQRDPSRRQWDDIVALMDRADRDLTRYAGSLVQAVLGQAHLVDRIGELAPKGAGRWADKMATLRLGAWVLAEVTGDREHRVLVDGWIAGQVDTGAENTLTLQILPSALAHTPRTNTPIILNDRATLRIPSPVLVRQDLVWFSPEHLATWWSEASRGRVEQRVATTEALREQARALGLGGKKGSDRRSISMDDGSTSIYWRCPPDLSRVLLGRASGDQTGSGQPDTVEGSAGSLVDEPTLGDLWHVSLDIANYPPED